MIKQIHSFILFCLLTFSAGAFAQSNQEDLVAYPNPTRSDLMIKVGQPGVKIRNISFYDILGTQVASYLVNASAVELQLGALRAGKYLMRYQLSDETIRVKQIIKQ